MQKEKNCKEREIERSKLVKNTRECKKARKRA